MHQCRFRRRADDDSAIGTIRSLSATPSVSDVCYGDAPQCARGRRPAGARVSTPRIGSGRGLTAPRRALYGPGRPRKEPNPGHNTGIDEANVGVNGAAERGAPVSQAVVPVRPRLLHLEAAAAYLGVSPWTI